MVNHMIEQRLSESLLDKLWRWVNKNMLRMLLKSAWHLVVQKNVSSWWMRFLVQPMKMSHYRCVVSPFVARNIGIKIWNFSSGYEKQTLKSKCLNCKFQAMMKDQFGNYVVQRVLETCDDQSRELILSRIKVHLNTLKKYTYGKHIVSLVEKLVATGGTCTFTRRIYCKWRFFFCERLYFVIKQLMFYDINILQRSTSGNPHLIPLRNDPILSWRMVFLGIYGLYMMGLCVDVVLLNKVG